MEVSDFDIRTMRGAEILLTTSEVQSEQKSNFVSFIVIGKNTEEKNN